jgi:hypothetical protein
LTFVDQFQIENFLFFQDVKDVVNAPQGSNPEEVKKAQDKLNAVQKELEKQRQTEESVKIQLST